MKAKTLLALTIAAASSLPLTGQTYTSGGATTGSTTHALHFFNGDKSTLTGASICIDFKVRAEWELDNHCGMEEVIREHGELYGGFQDSSVDYDRATYDATTGIYSTKNAIGQTEYYDPRTQSWSTNRPGPFTADRDCKPITATGETGIEFKASNPLLGGTFDSAVVAGDWTSTVHPLGDASGPNWDMGTVQATYSMEIDIANFMDFAGSGTTDVTIDSWIHHQLNNSTDPANTGHGWHFASLNTSVSIKYETIPEPSSAVLGLASIGLLAFRRRRA